MKYKLKIGDNSEKSKEETNAVTNDIMKVRLIAINC